MAQEDLKQYINSGIDFYDLLEVNAGASIPEIRKAWRRASLKYHPDKNSDPSAVEKFHLLQIALDVLCVDELRQQYDNKRAAEQSRKRDRDQWNEKKRKMVEDLERREREGRPRKPGNDPEQDEQDAKLERIAADTKRRRLELTEKRRREREEVELAWSTANQVPEQTSTTTSKLTRTSAEEDRRDRRRSILLHWRREGKGEHVHKERLSSLFAQFGVVDTVILIKDKKKRVDGVKKITASGYVVFESILGAHAVYQGVEKLKSEEPWIDEILWITEKDAQSEGASQDQQPSLTHGGGDQHKQTPSTKLVFGTGEFPLPPSPEGDSEEIFVIRCIIAEKKRQEKLRAAQAAKDTEEEVQAKEQERPQFEGVEQDQEPSLTPSGEERQPLTSMSSSRKSKTPVPSFGKNAFPTRPSSKAPVPSFGKNAFPTPPPPPPPSGQGPAALSIADWEQRRAAALKDWEQKIREEDAAEDAALESSKAA